MAKLRDDPMSAADLRRYLDSQSDFGLELAIYAKARSLGFPATHGGTYEDPVTAKTRQFDVRAFAVKDDFRVDLAIECKSLKSSYPLVLSRIPRDKNECFHHVIWSHERSGGPLYRYEGVSAKDLHLQEPEGMYPIGEMVGKATTQVGLNDKEQFQSGDTEVYDKWSQALGSAADLVQCAADYGDDLKKAFSSVILPFLVVANDTLWTADYTMQGSLMSDPKQCSHATLFLGHEYWKPGGISYTASHLHVCTRAGMEEFLDRLVHDDGLWKSLFPIGKILAAAAS